MFGIHLPRWRSGVRQITNQSCSLKDRGRCFETAAAANTSTVILRSGPTFMVITIPHQCRLLSRFYKTRRQLSWRKRSWNCFRAARSAAFFIPTTVPREWKSPCESPASIGNCTVHPVIALFLFATLIMEIPPALPVSAQRKCFKPGFRNGTSRGAKSIILRNYMLCRTPRRS